MEIDEIDLAERSNQSFPETQVIFARWGLLFPIINSGSMARSLSYILVIACIGHVIAEKESNILKLSKPQILASIGINTTNVNETEYIEKKDEGRKRSPLVAFSKNNPEQDWKNYLKTFASENEEEHEDLDIDFMKDKFERTPNSIQWLADLYDPLRWTRVPGKLQNECRRDMEKFLDGLRNGQVWAAKSK